MATHNFTGYGPRSRLIFDGDERKYELWETKFYGYLHTLKLKKELEKDTPDAGKNADVYAELIQLLDDRSLALVMRDARDDGKKALEILREHYMSQGKPKVIALYTELTTLEKGREESTTDYVLRAEAAAAALKNSGEIIGDSLLIAMILKGLPSSFNSFKTVVTQKDKQPTFQQFKVSLRAFEESEHSNVKSDSVMKADFKKPHSQIVCYTCKKKGHKSTECRQKRWCDNCKSKTHDTRFCRKKVKDDSAKKLSEEKVNVSEEKVNFYFKVGVDPNIENVELENVNLLVDCGATTHIINDESKFVSFEKSFNPEEHYIELADGSRTNNVAVKKGTAKFYLEDVDGKMHDIYLENALYAPSYKQNIFSVQAATEKGATIDFSSDKASLTTSGTKFDIKKKDRLYYLNKCKAESAKQVNHDVRVWHQIFGHCNVQDVLKLPAVVKGMNITDKTSKLFCEPCTLGKMTEFKSRVPDEKAKMPLELVHSDLAGPVDPVSIDGYRYTLSFTDDYSGLIMIYFLKQKSDTVEATKKFLADVSPFGKVKCVRSDLTVKRLRSDNGGEFISKEFEALLVSHGIRHEKSAPNSPHQNGTAERGWRSLFEMGRCLLIEAKLPKYLWTYAVLTASYIRNRCYNARLNKTPYEAFTGMKPSVQNMNIFGTVCYAYVTEKKKLDPRSEKGLFLGYDKYSPAYFIYFPETKQIKKVRRVVFTSDFLQTSKDVYEADCDEGYYYRTVPRDESVDITPQVESVPTPVRRYPTRERRPPDYFYNVNEDEHDDNITVDFCYTARDLPQTYNEAIRSPESAKWKDAMDNEMSSLKENDTFTLTPLPQGKQAVGGRWVYAVKESADGTLTHKARYVAKGYSQIKDVDYFETYAPTTKMTSVRVLMQLAAQLDLVVHQLDVKTAYLNSPIDCEIYLEQAEGYEIEGENNEKLVYKLNKSLYGLKQSGRNWNSVLNDELIEIGFKQSLADPCMYVKHDGKNIVIILIWVDDILVASSSTSMLDNVKVMLSKKFKMKDLGVISRFLGIDFKVKPGNITMSQESYLKKVLERFGMADCKPKSLPSEQKLTFSEKAEPFDPKRYSEAIGSLIYAMTCTRPDISWIVTKLAQFAQRPTIDHWTALKHVFRYLKGTLDYKLCFQKCENDLKLTGFSDADWGGAEDRKSTSGYCFMLNKSGAAISWRSKKQPTVALSTCEAEYIATTIATQEAKFLTQLLDEIDVQKTVQPVELFVDNQGTIALAKDPIRNQRSKHIDIKYHFIRSEIKNGSIAVYYVPSEDNVADVFTKPMTSGKRDLVKNIFGIK